MATKVVKLNSFKRGDTPVFTFIFTAPSVGYSWASTTADAAFTLVTAPNDNTGAAFTRIAQSLTTNPDGSATLSIQPTVVESKALVPNSNYKLEVQLKDGGGTNVATAITAQVLVEQDYII